MSMARGSLKAACRRLLHGGGTWVRSVPIWKPYGKGSFCSPQMSQIDAPDFAPSGGLVPGQPPASYTVSPRTRSSGVCRARTSRAAPPSMSTSAGRGLEL